MEANGLEIRSKTTELVPQENIEKEVIGKIRCAYDELVDISKLIPNPKNPNKHTDDQIKRLAEIIDYTGMRRPIAVSNRSGFMTCGHGRLLALKLLGWTKAPVSFQDYDDEAQEYADMTADNAIAEWAELDLGKINLDIQEVGPFDIKMLGLKGFTIEPMDNLGLSAEVANGPSALDKLEKYLGKEFLEVRLEYNQEEYDEFISLAAPLMETYETENLSDAVLRHLRG